MVSVAGQPQGTLPREIVIICLIVYYDRSVLLNERTEQKW